MDSSGSLKTFFHTFLLIVASIWLQACNNDEPSFDENTPKGNIEALAHIIDTRYCFIDEKGLDWDMISRKYIDKANPGMNDKELFNLCADMLAELKDGHVNLSSRFNTSYYRKWWSQYPQNFNFRTIEENYLQFNWEITSGIYYKVINDDIGYLYYPSFSNNISETSLNYILAWFWNCKVLIIDVRNNGGGLLTNVHTLTGRFIKKKMIGGYITHKTGPGHNDFSDPYPIEYKPGPEGALIWEKPVFVLTNRSCFSAANNFVAVMKALPQVTIIGARTGGGGGLPFTSELPNGWSVRFSASPVTDGDGNSIENGIDPTPGYECGGSEEIYASGTDPILERALSEAAKL